MWLDGTMAGAGSLAATTRSRGSEVHDPMVRDLDTGVVYGRGWHFTPDDDMPATEIPHEVRADLTVVERVLGRVTGARVLSGLLPEESGRHGWITTLLVDPE